MHETVDAEEDWGSAYTNVMCNVVQFCSEYQPKFLLNVSYNVHVLHFIGFQPSGCFHAMSVHSMLLGVYLRIVLMLTVVDHGIHTVHCSRITSRLTSSVLTQCCVKRRP